MKQTKTMFATIVLGAAFVAGNPSPAQAVPTSVYGYICSVPDYGTDAAITLYSGKNCTGSYIGWYSFSPSTKPEPVYSQMVNRLQQQLFYQTQVYIASDSSGSINYIVYYQS